MRVLAAFDESHPRRTLSDLSRASEIPKTTVHRIVPGSNRTASPAGRAPGRHRRRDDGHAPPALRPQHVLLGLAHANCQAPGAGCTPGSAPLQWLQSDLAAHPTQCLAGYWHQSRFFSMENHGTEEGPSSDTSMSPIWDILQAHGADVVVSAHIHFYERFPRQSSAGNLDPTGMREFIVGTGGGHPDTFDPAHTDPHSEFRRDGTFGVLKLTLHGDGYDWAFEGTDGSVVDTGTDSCNPSGGTPPTTSSPAPTSTTTAPKADPGPPRKPRSGYWMLSADGTVFPSATPPSTATCREPRSTARSSTPFRPRPVRATTWWPATAASSPSATHGSLARWAASG